ncbi:hypothetical protein, partial [Yinghuangia soli]
RTLTGSATEPPNTGWILKTSNRRPARRSQPSNPANLSGHSTRTTRRYDEDADDELGEAMAWFEPFRASQFVHPFLLGGPALSGRSD